MNRRQINLLKTIQAGVYGKCVLKQNQIVFNWLIMNIAYKIQTITIICLKYYDT